MKKKMLLLFQLVTKILIILLALSTFFTQKQNPANYSDNFFVSLFSLDHFYTSPLLVVLFSILVLMLIIPIFMGIFKSKNQVALHVVIALAFGIIIFDKTSNFRTMMPIMEGETVNFSKIVDDKSYNDKIYLDQFIIQYHEGSRMPSAFTSHLVLNETDSVKLNVNKPVEIGHYRLYQNAYDKIPIYELTFAGSEYELMPDDTLSVDGHELRLHIREDRKGMVFHFNQQEKELSVQGGEFTIAEFEFSLAVKEMKNLSVIEVASVKGMKILLLLGLLYLVLLGICFWRKK